MQLEDVCNFRSSAKITKIAAPRIAKMQAEEKLDRVFSDVMGQLRVE